MFRPNDEPVPGYQLQRMLGRGGFGEVWRALGPGRTPAALKFIGLCGRPGIREFRAIQKVKEIRHAHLLPMHALWILDDQNSVIDDARLGELEQTALEGGGSKLPAPGSPSTLVVAMMLADMSLMDMLYRYQWHGAAGIPPLELLRYLEDAARGIDFLNGRQHDLGHGPIAVQHCDIKPHNIVLLGDSAMVCDFGLARVLDESQVTSGMSGTPAYMAPESIQGKRPSSTTDQYSLAITYYHLRCGVVPFAGSTTHRDMMLMHVEGTLDFSHVSPPEQEILRRATSIKPEDRFATAVEMVKQLQQCTFDAPLISLEGLSSEAIWCTVQACDEDGARDTIDRQVLPAEQTQAGPQEKPEQEPERERARERAREREAQEQDGDDDYPLGEDVRIALLGAAAAMKRTHWNIISTVHLWIGMTYIDDGVLCTAMRSRGIDPTETRRVMRAAIRRESTDKEASASILSENSEAALSAARRLARRLGSDKVRERHLLQSILDTPDAGARLILEMIGLDRSQLMLDEQPGPSKSSSSVSPFDQARSDSSTGIEILDTDGWLALGSFDSQARASLEAARRATEKMGQAQIRMPHLFLGMLEREDSVVGLRLRQSGVDVAELGEIFRMLVASVSRSGPVSVELHRDSFSDNVLQLLREAGRAARQHGATILSEHRLLNALFEGESIVARTLRVNGVDPALLFPGSGRYDPEVK